VIDNARAFAQSERRRQWLEASAKIVDALQPPVRLDDALRQIAIGARRASGASAVAVVQRREGEDRVAAADGVHVLAVPELVHSLTEHIDRAEKSADLVVVPRGGQATVVLVPLRAHLAGDGATEIELHKDWGETRITGQTNLSAPPWDWGKR
jgi:hypothetical protein